MFNTLMGRAKREMESGTCRRRTLGKLEYHGAGGLQHGGARGLECGLDGDAGGGTETLGCMYEL